MQKINANTYRAGSFGAAFFEHAIENGFGGRRTHPDKIAFNITYPGDNTPIAEITRVKRTGVSYVDIHPGKNDSQKIRDAKNRLRSLADKF